MRCVLACTLAAAIAVVSFPAASSAQTSDDDLARAHFDSGSAYYERGRYGDAAREFLEAYRLSARPVLLENAARAYERDLNYDEAIVALERLLSQYPDYPQAGTIRERMANYERLRDRLASQRDGAAGGEGAARDDDDAEPEPPAGVEDQGGGEGGGVSMPGIITLVGGGLLGVASIVTGVASQVIYDELATACGGVCPPDRQVDVDTGEGLALASTILMFPSIAAIGVGVVLLIVDTGGGQDERASLRLVPGPGDTGLAVQGSF